MQVALFQSLNLLQIYAENEGEFFTRRCTKINNFNGA